MNALQQAVERIAEGTPLRQQADAELADLHAQLDALKRERDAYKKIVDDVRAGNYDNAHDITAARKFIFAQLAALSEKAG